MSTSPFSRGRNVFSGGTGRYGMTETGEHLLAGILAGLQDATGLFAPSPLSYARLLPGHWAGAYACWGLENREPPCGSSRAPSPAAARARTAS